MKNTRPRKRLILRTDEQRRAIASPLRIELIGLFIDRQPLSVAQMAARMGRPASAIHYHVRLLEKAGLLRRVGEQLSGRRPEAIYMPVAEAFMMESPKAGKESAAGEAEAVVKTMATAFRMAERDMKAALADPGTRTTGPQRNFLGARAHCRLAKKDLAELNRHFREIEKMLTRVQKTHVPSPGDVFVSLTLALMPLRNRGARP